MDNKRDCDTDHPSKKKCNQPDCQKSKCLYVHKTLMPTSNDVINQQDAQRFTCKTCQNNFMDNNLLIHYRICEHKSNIVLKYFLTTTCRRSSNQGALCWFRHDQLPLSAPKVANAKQEWHHLSPPCVTQIFPYFLRWAWALCQDYSNK